MGIRPKDVTLGYISTFWPYEGIQFLLRAAAELVGRGLPVRVVLVGEGAMFVGLQQLAADLGSGSASRSLAASPIRRCSPTTG